MKITMHKFLAITGMKFKMLCNNKNLMIAPIMALGLTLLMRVLGNTIGGDDAGDYFSVMALSYGLNISILMTGMFVTSAALAEEKEKHTLRTLMTSSVNSLEFFLGSIVPPMVIITVVDIAIVFISGIDIGKVNLGVYLLVSTIAGLTSCIIGMLIGLLSKNQMAASTLTTPFLMVFMLVPMFSGFNETMEKVSSLLFSGVLTDMVNSYGTEAVYRVSAMNVVVLIGEIILAVLLFVYAYKKNGYESD